MSQNARSVGAFLLFLLGLGGAFSGGLIAYLGYHQKNILDKCLSGLTCPYKYGQLELEALQSAARAQLDMGAALVLISLIMVGYSSILLFRKKRSGDSVLQLAKSTPRFE
ncbi:MAG: hypothetical protein ACYC7D_13870 [Nitrososphaerales archaeon]